METNKSNIILTELARDGWKAYPKNKFYIDKAEKIFRVKDNLWLLSNKSIAVYTTDGNHVKNITNENIKKLKSVCVLSNKVIVTADSGIFALDTDGQFLYLMKEGKFIDVCYFNNELYALKWGKNKVIVFTNDNGIWNAKKAIKLEFDFPDKHKLDTIAVTKENIYIGSYSMDTVFFFEHTGGYVKQHIMSTMSSVQFSKYGSFISSSDARGNVLVTNMSYHRLQILTPNRDDDIKIKLNGVSYPQDVCIWDTHMMYFVCEFGIRLVKCELVKEE